jgi:penicillin-binding protein 1A
VVDDSALDNRAVMIGGTTGILGEWGPEREDNRYEGPITARQALAKSKNSATVRLGMRAGLDNVLELSKTSGIRSPLRPFPATFLGASEVTLAELALAYTTFPNGGWRPAAPFILDRIEEKDGTIVWQSKQDRTRQQVMKPESAFEVHSCLVDALETGTGSAARPEIRAAAIPGSRQDRHRLRLHRSALCGLQQRHHRRRSAAGFDKPEKIYRGAFGSQIALPVWVDVMNASAQRYVPREIAQPAAVLKVEICSKSGLLATDKCEEKGKRTSFHEIAAKEQMPTEPCSVHGDARARIVRDLPDAGVPRASLAVDTAQVKPVALKGPTLLADNDPYNAVKSTVRPPKPADPADNEVKPIVPAETTAGVAAGDTPPVPAGTPDEDAPVLRAQPVEPTERQPVVQQPTERALPAQPVERAQPVQPTARPLQPDWRSQPAQPTQRVPRPQATAVPAEQEPARRAEPVLRAEPVNPRAPVRRERVVPRAQQPDDEEGDE